MLAALRPQLVPKRMGERQSHVLLLARCSWCCLERGGWLSAPLFLQTHTYSKELRSILGKKSTPWPLRFMDKYAPKSLTALFSSEMRRSVSQRQTCFFFLRIISCGHDINCSDLNNKCFSFQVFMNLIEKCADKLTPPSASSCLLTQAEIKRCPGPPTAPKRRGPQLGRWCDSSKPVSITLCHETRLFQSPVVDLCHEELLLRVFSIWPWNGSSCVMSSSQLKEMTPPQGHVQPGWLL